MYQARGDLRLAQQQLAEALDIARQLRWQRVEAEILLGRADIALLLDGPRTALQLYQESAEIARQAAPAAWVLTQVGQSGSLPLKPTARLKIASVRGLISSTQENASWASVFRLGQNRENPR